MLSVFADAEGTIFFNDFQLAKGLLEDLEFFKKNQGIFIINTGLATSSQLQQFALRLSADYLMTSNGYSAEDMEGNVIFRADCFDEKTLERILERSKENNWVVSFENQVDSKNYFFNKESEFLEDLRSSLSEKRYSIQIEDFSILKSMIVKNLTLWGNLEESRGFQKFLESLALDWRQKSHNCFEIFFLPNNKRTGFLRLSFILDLDPRESMAIGDGWNDREVLQEAGYSYAMANADLETKNCAKFHTSRVEQNGFGEALLDYMYRAKKIIPPKSF